MPDCLKWLDAYMRDAGTARPKEVYQEGRKHGFLKSEITIARKVLGKRVTTAEQNGFVVWKAQESESIDTDCKNKIYADDEYTLCTKCEKAKGCESARRCFDCAGTAGVFYSRRRDVFCCEKCLYNFEAARMRK